MSKIVKTTNILFFLLCTFVTAEDVKFNIVEVKKTREVWHNNLNPRVAQVKYFDAILYSNTGKQYAASAVIMGNRACFIFPRKLLYTFCDFFFFEYAGADTCYELSQGRKDAKKDS